ncbi:hypothetical protein [Shouchella shacheensis]|uniref:hypothetical protein n=1 Tax=Shouchella shacheensis TaxID=1649580 RepID=UPI0007402F13|nr:hypothetical protein [Shouchella shacheensis]
MKKLLERTVDRNEELQMIYLDANGHCTHREVTVFAVSETTVVGFCHYRGQPRIFRRGNILSVFPVKRRETVWKG